MAIFVLLRSLVFLPIGHSIRSFDTCHASSGDADISVRQSLLQKESTRQMRIVESATYPAESFAMLSLDATDHSSTGAASPKQAPLGDWNNQQLFYQFHMPRTGGSFTANLLYSFMCEPSADEIEMLAWNVSCNKSCATGLTDNEFACNPDVEPVRWVILHSEFARHRTRAEDLKNHRGVSEIVYVTTLRSGAQRLLSQWHKEVFHGSWKPSSGIPADGNESLKMYIRENEGEHWLNFPSVFYRNNLQVSSLASVSRTVPTLEDLEIAKHLLLTGPWIIGFTGCLHTMQEKLQAVAGQVNSEFKPKAMLVQEYREENVKDTLDLRSFNQDTIDLLMAETALDNELFKWAWNLASKNDDPRWAATC
jgi:hypothetical protein